MSEQEDFFQIFGDEVEFEEWLEAKRARKIKPCPACGFPTDVDAICCEDCDSGWE